MRNAQTKRDAAHQDFSSRTLEWFREGDELAANADGEHVEYYNERGWLRRRTGRTGIAVSTLIVGLVALGWLIA